MTIKELAKKYELDKDDFWCMERSKQKIWILKHDACEKIAYQESIQLIDIEALNSTETLVRFFITMSKGDLKIKTIGEASKTNCKASYLGCMAEKRGIDRAVLKLINAYQFGIYSEVEAENFKKENCVEEKHWDKQVDKANEEFDKLNKGEKNG